MSTEAITTDEVRSLAARLLTDELAVVPVRHHSPACAWQVRRAIDELRPCVVLIEGPRGFDAQIPLLTHPQARMPLAVYAYAVRRAGTGAARAEERHSAFYPFCDYSPELVALREGTARGIACRFIDLEFAEQCVADKTPDTAHAAAAGGNERSLLDESHLRHSRGLRLLAERLGCRDHEDLWERLFEADPGGVSLAEHAARITAYCEPARRDHTTEALAADGTSAREAEMVWHIREALDRRRPGDGPVLVVVGGFHAVALPALLAGPPPRPRIPMRGVDGGAALIRYTFARLERLNGYAAGMTSPAWHQLLWQRLVESEDGEHPRASATLTALLDVAHELRTRHRLPVAVPSVTAAYGQALRLAGLRDRSAPLRSDLVDAIASCFVKGDIDAEGVLVHAAVRRTLTGDAIGGVPPGAGTPPLVGDVLARLRRQRLRVDEAERKAVGLDIYRRPAHRVTSRLLHGLALLGVPFAARTAGPDFVTGTGLGRLRERWEYLWTPATEGALVEASVLGSTLAAAVNAKFELLLAAQAESTSRQGASGAVALVTHACLLGLHHHVTRTLDLVRARIGVDASFPGVVAAATAIGVLWEAREPLEARQVDELPALLRTAYERAIYLGSGLRGSEADPADAAQALVQLRELLVGDAGSRLDEELYWRMCDGLLAGHEDPLVRGAATGLVYSAGRIDSAGLARAVGGHLSGTARPRDAVGFLRGLLMTAREVAWQERELLARIDARLSQWDAPTFIAHLPELRLAFAGMTPVETDRIARAVAGLRGGDDIGPMYRRDVDERSVRRNLEVSQAVAALLARDGLAEWGGVS